MRRREVETVNAMPSKLASYAPDPLTLTEEEWEAGYEKWSRDRAVWASSHGVELLPGFVGDAPFDATTL